MLILFIIMAALNLLLATAGYLIVKGMREDNETRWDTIEKSIINYVKNEISRNHKETHDLTAKIFKYLEDLKPTTPKNPQKTSSQK